MKLSNFVLLFMGIAICFMIVLFLSIDITSKKNVENIEFSNKLTSACYDAAQSMHNKNIEKFGCVWHNESELEDTLNTFYSSLAYSLNWDTAGRNNEIALYTPMVVLIDINGYYISHNIVFDESGMVAMSEEGKANSDYKNGISGLNTWSEMSEDKIVRYFLNDDVEVYMTDGTAYRGNRKDVYQIIRDHNPTATGIDYLIDDDEYNERKNNLIIREINKQCEYYLNRHNLLSDNHYELQYSFEMPEVSGEQWNRMLQNPTVISFLQGYTSTTDNKILNLYALAAGELVDNYHYFIDGSGMYHNIESEMLAGNCSTVLHEREVENLVNGFKTREVYREYLYRGVTIEDIYYTQTDCARKGAMPHDCVFEWP